MTKEFNEIEQQAKQRREAVRATVATNPYRDQVIEEVAQQVEKQFGLEVATYIRELKE
jgi:hypothetical protein